MSALTPFVFLSVILGAYTREPQCSEYHFLENLLERVIRMESKMDGISSDLQREVESVRKDLDTKLASSGTDLVDRIQRLEGNVKDATDRIKAVQTPPFPGQLFPRQNDAQTVAFTAYLAKNSTLTQGGIIIFEHVLSNQGDQYNPASGEFTSKRQGLFLFTWHTMSNSHLVTCLSLNGKCQIHAFAAKGDYTNDGNSAILTLAEGDKVAIKAVYGTQMNAASNRFYPTFTGYSL